MGNINREATSVKPHGKRIQRMGQRARRSRETNEYCPSRHFNRNAMNLVSEMI